MKISDEDKQWLTCVLNSRGSLSIVKAKERGPRGIRYETRFHLSSTDHKNVAKFKRILGKGRVYKVNNKAFRRGYAWNYALSCTADIERLLNNIYIEQLEGSRRLRAELLSEYMKTQVKSNGMTDTIFAKRTLIYNQYKQITKREWCE